jgi:hypothetical protein
MKIVPNRIVTSLVVFLLPLTAVFAAPGPPPPSTPPPPPGSPLDGGILILALVSLTYGLYKTTEINRKKASK